MIREYLSSASMPIQVAPTKTVGSRTGYTTDKIIQEDAIDFRTLRGKKLFYLLYRRDPMGGRVVDALTSLTLAKGFKIMPPHRKARNVIKEFLYTLHPTDPINALMVWLEALGRDGSWAGDGWWERKFAKQFTAETEEPFKGNKWIGLKKVHPLTMDFKREVNGDIMLDTEGWFGPKDEFLGYTQESEDGLKKRDIDKRRIMHLTIKTIGDEILGISDLENIYKTRHRAANIEDGIAQGAFRHGVPFLDVIVGDDAHPPDVGMMDKAKNEVKGSSYMSEFVHPPWYKVKMFEQFSLAKSEGMLEPYINLVATATGLPRPLLTGSGEGTNKATVKELVAMLPDMVILPRQRAIKLFLEDQLFTPLMEMNKITEIPYIQWNEIFPANDTYAQRLKILASIFFENKPVISWAEAREMLHMPSEEEGTIYSLSRQELSANSRGILLVEPHGRLIHEGLKTSILTKKDFPGMVNIPLILVSGNQAYGIIKLNEPSKIDAEGFKKFMPSHRVSKEEAEKWWPDAKGLNRFTFRNVKMFPKPKKVKVPQGVQKFISNVQFLSEVGENTINIKDGEQFDRAPAGK